MNWKSRRELRGEELPTKKDRKREAKATGVRGEAYAYWYLRKKGYVFVARNYIPRGAKGEQDLVGYDGEALSFVEGQTRTVRDGPAALPELSVTPDKQSAVVRTAKRFLAERHAADRPCRFDVLAIDNHPAPGAIAQGRVQPANVKRRRRRGTI